MRETCSLLTHQRHRHHHARGRDVPLHLVTPNHQCTRSTPPPSTTMSVYGCSRPAHTAFGAEYRLSKWRSRASGSGSQPTSMPKASAVTNARRAATDRLSRHQSASKSSTATQVNHPKERRVPSRLGTRACAFVCSTTPIPGFAASYGYRLSRRGH